MNAQDFENWLNSRTPDEIKSADRIFGQLLMDNANYADGRISYEASMELMHAAIIVADNQS